MNSFNFDQIHQRRGTDSRKWHTYADNVLPLWVADMDFQAPPVVLQALQARVAEGIFGYGGVQKQLAEVICQRLLQQYQWSVSPEHIVFLPGLVSALNLTCRTVCQSGEAVLVQTPIYPPFLTAPINQGLSLITSELTVHRQGQHLEYAIDFAQFEAAITPQTKLFMLCNPHNPVGRCFNDTELKQLADICLRHDLIICADEIHCELLLGSVQHRPMATLAPEIADRCITLMAPSKTFNVAGLFCGFAIVQNPQLRKRLKQTAYGSLPEVNLLGLTAALAAYQHAEPWRLALLDYLKANRDFFIQTLNDQLPMLKTTVPEGTYLAWIDCREAGITGNAQRFFLEKALLAFNPGEEFGAGGEGFVRLNFACPRSTLNQALQQMQQALYTV